MRIEGEVHRSLAGRAGWPILIVLMVTAAVQAMGYLLPTVWHDDRFTGDAAQHTWWLYRYADPTLFPNDFIAAHYSQPAYSPAGFRAIVRLLTPLIDAQRLTESVAIVLALVAIVLTAVLGKVVAKKTGAAAAVAVFIACHAERLVEGGFPRSFGLVLILAGMIALVRRRWTILGLILLASSLLYAPAVLSLVPVIAVTIAWNVRRHGRLPNGFTQLAVLGTITAGLLASVYLRPMPPEFGRWFTKTELQAMPEWSADGRSAYFYDDWRDRYFRSPVSGVGLPFPIAMAAVALLGLGLLWRRDAVPVEVWALLLTSLALWAAAHLLLLRLYLPSRYTTYTLPVFAMLWSAAMARQLKRVWLDRPRGGLLTMPRLRVVGGVAATAVLAVVVARAIATRPKVPAWTHAGFADVLPTLRGLPADALVAAHPEDANAIPLRCRRSVLVNSETSIAFHTGYYDEMRQRLNAVFNMLYAVDWPTIDAIADRYRVSVFVLDRARLITPDERPYFEPFREANLARISVGRGSGFAMLSPRPDRIIFESGDWVVLRVGGGVR